MQADGARDNVPLNRVTITSETRVSNVENVGEINGVTYNPNTKVTEGLEEGPKDVNRIPERATHTVDK